jgi:hypothetical protein
LRGDIDILVSGPMVILAELYKCGAAKGIRELPVRPLPTHTGIGRTGQSGICEIVRT